jgi:radical SAM superfamily enzyme YgiQ (UPF0313 family)
MKILLVRPRPVAETIGLQHVMLVEPLELEVLAALTSSDDEPVIIDMILEKKEIEHFLVLHKPDILCVTGYITNVPEMVSYCRQAKRINPKIVTIVGGVHVEVIPEDLDDAGIDFRVVRNPTRAFPALLEHIKSGAELPPGVLAPRENISDRVMPEFDFFFPRPRRDLINHYKSQYFYIFHNRVALLKTAFGCPFQCNFCFCRRITEDHFHERPMSDVLDELQSLEETEIYIVDDDFLVSRQRVREFLDGISARNIKKNYLLYGRSDFIVKHTDLVTEFKNKGLKTVIVGFESFKNEELEAYNKLSDAETNIQAMKILNNLGIDCYATVIIPPQWDKADFNFLGEKLEELNIRYVNLQPLTPLPGTGFKVPEDRLLIHRSDYAKWDLAHVAIKPDKLSLSEFYNQIIKLYERVLFRPSVLLGHLRYSPSMLWKIAKGSYMVRRQYQQKAREAKH